MKTLRASTEDWRPGLQQYIAAAGLNFKRLNYYFKANLVGFKLKRTPLFNSSAFRSYSSLHYYH